MLRVLRICFFSVLLSNDPFRVKANNWSNLCYSISGVLWPVICTLKGPVLLTKVISYPFLNLIIRHKRWNDISDSSSVMQHFQLKVISEEQRTFWVQDIECRKHWLELVLPTPENDNGHRSSFLCTTRAGGYMEFTRYVAGCRTWDV